MVEFIHDVGMSEEKAEFVRNDKIRTEVFIPLEKRIAREKPELVVSLQKLQDLLGIERFASRISKVQNINKSGKNLLIVAGNERLRTLLAVSHPIFLRASIIQASISSENSSRSTSSSASPSSISR